MISHVFFGSCSGSCRICYRILGIAVVTVVLWIERRGSSLLPEVLLIIREFRTTERLARDSDARGLGQLTRCGLGWRMVLPCR